MRALLPALLLAALAAPLALAIPHAYAGTLRQGEADAFTYDNTPYAACTLQGTTWVVNLAYAPATDVLTLRAGGLSATGANGFASLALPGGTCMRFDGAVEGTQVAGEATYAVEVHAFGDGRPLD